MYKTQTAKSKLQSCKQIYRSVRILRGKCRKRVAPRSKVAMGPVVEEFEEGPEYEARYVRPDVEQQRQLPNWKYPISRKVIGMKSSKRVDWSRAVPACPCWAG